jgi:hypothetical protein
MSFDLQCHILVRKGESQIMERQETRLVEEGNTIYEIDLDCMRRKQRKKNQEQRNRNQEISGDEGPSPVQDFS